MGDESEHAGVAHLVGDAQIEQAVVGLFVAACPTGALLSSDAQAMHRPDS
jgi:NADH dehydrogenase/NADH:ubiquinone oxidoreductase subunit G